MPYHKEHGNSACQPGQIAVVKNDDGRLMGCHDSEAAADRQLAALYAAEARRQEKS